MDPHVSMVEGTTLQVAQSQSLQETTPTSNLKNMLKTLGKPGHASTLGIMNQKWNLLVLGLTRYHYASPHVMMSELAYIAIFLQP